MLRASYTHQPQSGQMSRSCELPWMARRAYCTQPTVQSARAHVVRTDLDSSFSSSSLADASSSSWSCRSANPNASVPCRSVRSTTSPDCRHTTRFCNSSHKSESSDTFFAWTFYNLFIFSTMLRVAALSLSLSAVAAGLDSDGIGVGLPFVLSQVVACRRCTFIWSNHLTPIV